MPKKVILRSINHVYIYWSINIENWINDLEKHINLSQVVKMKNIRQLL